MKGLTTALGACALLSACSAGDAETVSTGPLHFTDVTAETGIDMVVTSGVNPPTMLLEVKGSGLALIDYDDDGDLDVFVPNGATLEDPNQGPGARLYRNLGNLRFEDVTEEVGITFARWAYGTSVGDYDGNGFDDIYITCYGPNELLANRGGERFEEVGAKAGVRGDVWSSGSSFGDIDRDGDLDLYVVNYVELDAAGPRPTSNFLGAQVFAGPMGMPGVEDVLYENRGDGTFIDISVAAGIRSRPASWGLGAVILDFDGDHQPDIYVGNDSQPSFLFRGLGEGRFQEVGTARGIALNEDGAGQATMGIAVGDVDGSGTPDVFTTNFMYDTNTLHVNLGGLIFEDRTKAYGLYLDGRPFLSWTTAFFDFDHDADEDLIFFNGHIYPREVCREHGWGYDQTPVLHVRDGRRFRRCQPEEGGAWLAEPHCDRSAAFGDLDGDGDIDMAVCERNGPLRILRNDRDGGDWLIVALDDLRPGHDHRGLGARVSVQAGSRVQHRWIASGLGFLAASQPIAHFGLPAGTESVEVEVTWSDGWRQTVSDVPTGALRVVERKVKVVERK